jgi:hypothetical protein
MTRAFGGAVNEGALVSGANSPHIALRCRVAFLVSTPAGVPRFCFR